MWTEILHVRLTDLPNVIYTAFLVPCVCEITFLSEIVFLNSDIATDFQET